MRPERFRLLVAGRRQAPRLVTIVVKGHGVRAANAARTLYPTGCGAPVGRRRLVTVVVVCVCELWLEVLSFFK